MKLDSDITSFLEEVASSQSLFLGAWAAKILRADWISVQDIEQCLNLGFEF